MVSLQVPPLLKFLCVQSLAAFGMSRFCLSRHHGGWVTTLEDTVSSCGTCNAVSLRSSVYMLGELTSTAQQAGSALHLLVAKISPAPTRQAVHLCKMLFNCQLHGCIATLEQNSSRRCAMASMPQMMSTPTCSSV